jgi:hypothetical protein
MIQPLHHQYIDRIPFQIDIPLQEFANPYQLIRYPPFGSSMPLFEALGDQLK